VEVFSLTRPPPLLPSLKLSLNQGSTINSSRKCTQYKISMGHIPTDSGHVKITEDVSQDRVEHFEGTVFRTLAPSPSIPPPPLSLSLIYFIFCMILRAMKRESTMNWALTRSRLCHNSILPYPKELLAYQYLFPFI
jgi:hypothetical protein